MDEKTNRTHQSGQTATADFIIRNEIKDWFEMLAKKSCRPDVHINYESYAGHFNTHTKVKIRGNESQIIEAVEFIRKTRDILNYKLLWLNENTYYVYLESEQKLVEEKLKTIRDNGCDFNYKCMPYHMVGLWFMIFIFRPDLAETKQMEIDKIFKLLGTRNLFITSPKTSARKDQSTNNMATNILTAFHGRFLPYLDLQDISSLELANKWQDTYCDMNLDRDIQKFLRTKYPELFRRDNEQINLVYFTIKEVLRYFIQKYHTSANRFIVPNILTLDEINKLKRSYNILVDQDPVVHIDIKPMNHLGTVDFCVICHFKPIRCSFTNYDPKYATENYSINFKADDSLDSLYIPDFSSFLLKALNNYSPKQLNSVIKWVADNFRTNETATLILYEFNLNHVSDEVLSSLLNTMRHGSIKFNQMNFNLKTLISILEQSNLKMLIFIKCHFTIDNIKTIPINFQINHLWFCDMNIEINLLCNLKNLENMKIFNCRIFSTCWNVPSNFSTFDIIDINYTNFDKPTLLRLLNGLQCAQKLKFLSCNFMPSEHFERRHFTICNEISFTSMTFTLQTLFEIFENCEIQNQMVFVNCHFRWENGDLYKNVLKPVKLKFENIKYETIILLTILEMLNGESEVAIIGSCILPMDECINNSNKTVQVKRIGFFKCLLDMQTLFNILSRTSLRTKVFFSSCDLLQSAALYPNVLKNSSNVIFYETQLNLHQMLTILGFVKRNSVIKFSRCKITTANSEILPKLNQQLGIEIYFEAMVIESEIVWPILQTDSKIIFNSCYLMFTTDTFYNINNPIQSHVIFINIKFDLAMNLKSLANFTPKSNMVFRKCNFEIIKFAIPNIVLKPFCILFEGVTFELDVLVTILERISDQTRVAFYQCNIQPLTWEFSIAPIKIQSIKFTNMNLEIEIILRIFKRFTGLSSLRFVRSKIVCSNWKELSSIILKSELLAFNDMLIDIQIFQIIAKHCTYVMIDNCKIMAVHHNILVNMSVDFKFLIFKNMNYSSNLLQLLQNLTGHFIVRYEKQLSNRAIIEICTKTSVFGERLQLAIQINTTKSIYFELFAEFFQQLALNDDFDTETEYDPPSYLIPHNINSSCCDPYDWSVIKIKFVSVNDATVKLEFLKNGVPIDLFYEMNDLVDDSAECIVDYY